MRPKALSGQLHANTALQTNNSLHPVSPDPFGIWERNFQLGIYSIFTYITLISFEHTSHFSNWTPLALALSFLGAAGGLLVALSIKYGDSVLKTLAISGSIIYASIVDHICLDGPMNQQMGLSAIVVVIAVLNYNFDATPADPPEKAIENRDGAKADPPETLTENGDALVYIKFLCETYYWQHVQLLPARGLICIDKLVALKEAYLLYSHLWSECGRILRTEHIDILCRGDGCSKPNVVSRPRRRSGPQRVPRRHAPRSGVARQSLPPNVCRSVEGFKMTGPVNL